MKDNDQIHLNNITELIKEVGEDPARDGLLKTPSRFLESFKFLTSGYKSNPKEIVDDAVFTESYDDMVIVRDIEFYSLCEHHLIPFYGKVHVGYIPDGKVVGLSKIPRLVDAFSRRLQVQERLTHQIAGSLQEYLAPLGVGVVIESYHLCMMMRGVQKQNSFTITSSMQGCFRDLNTRNEFMSHVQTKRP